MFWHMFQYLAYLILAALIGLLVGWLIWSRGSQRDADALEARAQGLRSDMMALRRSRADAQEKVAVLRGRLAATGGAAGGAPQSLVGSDLPAEPAIPEDLERVEGIGPKMAAALNRHGIVNFAQLAAADEATLATALEADGLKFAPSLPTWAKQAQYLADGDEAGFTEYADFLQAGREPGAD